MHIEELTKDTLYKAIELVKKVFPYENFDEITWAFEGSLGVGDNKDWIKSKGTTSLTYFVAIENGQVIGTSGIYTLEKDDKEAAWLGWYCVDPDYRGKKIGAALFDIVIQKAKEKGKTFLRLYTSTHDNEAIANKIYDKKGFKFTHEEPNKETGETIVYKQLRLKGE
jgi:GNAT superfamily N-acetyltransferase